MRTLLLTALAMTAFAANSVLCRLALGAEQIGAAGFTVVRLLSGAVTLGLLHFFVNGKIRKKSGSNYWSPFFLFTYAAAFSFAYISLDTGTGALILFGAVQTTMLLYARFTGERLSAVEWLGAGIAFAGFLYLVLPGINTPSLWGFILMSISGAAWGIYTIRGKNSVDPLSDTAENFVKTIPFVLGLAVFIFFDSNISNEGFLLAAVSGSAASGIGYAIWYKALKGLKTNQAAVVQLSVPIIAAAGGVFFVGELLSIRLIIASLLVLGGIALTIVGKGHVTEAILSK